MTLPTLHTAEHHIDLHAARAIARGRVPHLHRDIEDTLRAQLDGEQVEITWTVPARQPTGSIERLTWQPGTPLPNHTLHATCTATTPT